MIRAGRRPRSTPGACVLAATLVLSSALASGCTTAATPAPPAEAAAPAASTAGGLRRPPGLAEVRGVRHWSYPTFTRISVELTRGVSAGAVRLPADPAAGRPERLYLDLEGVWIGRDYAEPIRIGDGLLQGVRLGQNTLTRTRVVIDLQHYESHRVMRLRGPDRLLVDVFGPREGDVPAAATMKGAAGANGRSKPSRTGRPEVPETLRHSEVVRPVRTVVIDPGHGGKDPGAQGPNGLVEKQITLRLAKRLRGELERRGFRVVLTREDDRTLDLEERTALAEGARGDLFVSLHCNAAERTTLSGIETWSLDAEDERHDDDVAARENGVPADQTDVLQRTVASLRISEAALPSALLAESVHGRILARVRAAHGDVVDLGAKKGPFYVLFLSSMPAVLVETGFVTSPLEAKRLADASYLQSLAEGIAAGIADYRERLAPVTAERAR